MRKITMQDLGQMFDSYLDETYGLAKVAGFGVVSSVALKRAGKPLYDFAMRDWIDTLIEDGSLKILNQEGSEFLLMEYVA